MQFLDKHGWPIERIRGRWFKNLIRLLLHTRQIRRDTSKAKWIEESVAGLSDPGMDNGPVLPDRVGKVCPRCNGSGQFQWEAIDGRAGHIVKCRGCNGTGKAKLYAPEPDVEPIPLKE